MLTFIARYPRAGMLGGCAMNNGANIAMPATADASDIFPFHCNVSPGSVSYKPRS